MEVGLSLAALEQTRSDPRRLVQGFQQVRVEIQPGVKPAPFGPIASLLAQERLLGGVGKSPD